MPISVPPAIAAAGLDVVELVPAQPMLGVPVTDDNLSALAALLPDGELAPYSTPTVRFRGHEGYIAEVEAGDVVVPLEGGAWFPIYRTDLGLVWLPVESEVEAGQ